MLCLLYYVSTEIKHTRFTNTNEERDIQIKGVRAGERASEREIREKKEQKKTESNGEKTI